jgi:C1A family cysteine protease
MRALVALLLVACVLGHGYTGKEAELVLNAKNLFEQFKKDYNKVYATDAEEQHRFNIFVENLIRAEERNRLGTEEHGVTQFMDITPSEFKQQYLGFYPKIHETLGKPQATSGYARVNCVGQTQCNYFNLGAVTPVKNQGQCGSCWAFSTTESVETAWFMANHTLDELSPQQIVDCDHTDAGCNGGDTPTAYAYVISAGGLETNAEYPYDAHDGVCKFNAADIDASINNWAWGITPCNTFATKDCNNQNETGMYTVVQQIGPQSICVDAQPWQTYKSGIFDSSTCLHGYYDLDHCVQATGYGTQSGTQYWLVKNSWGVTWGEQGYIRLVYGKNMCGVADEVTYSLGSSKVN